MIVLSNSSPLIYLSKLGKLDLLRILFNKIIVAQEVLIEVQGSRDYPELVPIEQAIKKKWIIVKETEIKTKFRGLGKGETSLIALAKETRPDLILVDDASARKIIEGLGYNVKGIIYVLLLAYRKKLIKKDEARKLVDNLILSGFRISTEIYAGIIKELE